MKVTFWLSCTFNHSAKLKEVVEFSDEATDDEIEEAFQDWQNNNLDMGWQKEEN